MRLKVTTLKSIFAAVLMAATGPTHAVFYTYSQWDALPANPRAAYMSGFYDALISFAKDEEDAKVGTHYQSCISKSKMTNIQLSDNVRAFASTRPSHQTSGVGGALIGYLIELCGRPP